MHSIAQLDDRTLGGSRHRFGAAAFVGAASAAVRPRIGAHRLVRGRRRRSWPRRSAAAGAPLSPALRPRVVGGRRNSNEATAWRSGVGWASHQQSQGRPHVRAGVREDTGAARPEHCAYVGLSWRGGQLAKLNNPNAALMSNGFHAGLGLMDRDGAAVCLQSSESSVSPSGRQSCHLVTRRVTKTGFGPLWAALGRFGIWGFSLWFLLLFSRLSLVVCSCGRPPRDRATRDSCLLGGADGVGTKSGR